MIDQADRFVVIDMFLFNEEHMACWCVRTTL